MIYCTFKQRGRQVVCNVSELSPYRVQQLNLDELPQMFALKSLISGDWYETADRNAECCYSGSDPKSKALFSS